MGRDAFGLDICTALPVKKVLQDRLVPGANSYISPCQDALSAPDEASTEVARFLIERGADISATNIVRDRLHVQLF